MKKIINITIGNDAKIFLETDGYKGPSCVNEIKSILSSFVEIENLELKSDYYDNDEELYIQKELKL